MRWINSSNVGIDQDISSEIAKKGISSTKRGPSAKDKRK